MLRVSGRTYLEYRREGSVLFWDNAQDFTKDFFDSNIMYDKLYMDLLLSKH